MARASGGGGRRWRTAVANGQSFRLPTFIANYYLAAWFDWQLKADAEAREHLFNPPFAAHVKLRHSGL